MLQQQGYVPGNRALSRSEGIAMIPRDSTGRDEARSGLVAREVCTLKPGVGHQ